jgi:maleamate amidohydrolase
MSDRIWNRFLTERDKLVFTASGYGTRGGFGKRPALLVVDVNYGFVGDRSEPILDSIKGWMNSCGEDGWKAVAVIKEVVRAGKKHPNNLYNWRSARRWVGSGRMGL